MIRMEVPNFTCSGKREALFGTGMGFHFRHSYRFRVAKVENNRETAKFHRNKILKIVYPFQVGKNQDFFFFGEIMTFILRPSSFGSASAAP